MSVTIHELAVHIHERAGHEIPTDGFTGQFYFDVNLPIMGGCACGTTVAAYNAYPGIDGYLHCWDCLAGQGYETVESALSDIFGEDA